MSSELDRHHLAAAYALDALEPDERIAFEAHYHDCHVCSHDVRDFRSTLAAIGELSVTTPPADLKARVLEQVAATRQLSPRVAPRTLAPAPARRTYLLAAAAALLLFVGATAFIVGRSSQSDDAFASQLEQVLAEPDVQMVDLTAMSATTEGRIRVAWSASAGQAVVLGDGLTAPSDGSVYELWLLDDSGAVPTQMLDPADGGEVRRILPMAGNPIKWGITIEPEAGSASPTGEILFLGDV
ncbi:MAG: anti-sigma factor [Ilumatobacteraceae bacterium]